MIHRSLKNYILDGGRIDAEQAAMLYHQASLEDLSQLATSVRNRFHKQDEATYLIMAIVNYTNVCVAACDYCSFYKLPHESGTYLLDFQQICEKIDDLRQLGGDLIGFNGGFHPKLRISDYADLFKNVRKHYCGILEFYEMTIAEFVFSCKVSRVSYEEGAQILKSAGVKFVSGGGAEVLADSFRTRHSPGKFSVDDYFEAQKAILDTGLGSTGTMVIGFDESLEERLLHLSRLRSFQDEMGGALISFLCWTYKPLHNRLGGEEISAEAYWRWLAICRIFLDNFVNIRASILTKNTSAVEALRYGANDFDLPTEDEVTQKAGANISHDFSTILDYAARMGFKMIKRKPYPQRLHFPNMSALT